MSLKVCEIFRSIQGEGLYMGKPTVFIRFAGCNLHCEKCDTKYSWNIGHKTDWKDVVQSARSLSRSGDHFCLTGGEPLIQNQTQLEWLCRHLYGVVTIETNGTISPPRSLIRAIDVWSVSPKLTSFAGRKTYDTSILRELILNLSDRSFLKFVVSTSDDVWEIKDILKETVDELLIDIPIVLQPESRIASEVGYFKFLEKMYTWSRPLHYYDVRILPQLHYLIWRGERGK